MAYIEIINNELGKLYNELPSSYKNISNFNSLDDLKLRDLSWSGNYVKFYKLIEQGLPETFDPQLKVTGPSYVIDDEAAIVYANYTIENIDPINIPVIIPQTISARQIRLWLLQNGISLQMVSDAIATIEDPITRDSVSIEWEYAPYIERSHPMLVPLAQALGLSEADIDRGFTEAVNI